MKPVHTIHFLSLPALRVVRIVSAFPCERADVNRDVHVEFVTGTEQLEVDPAEFYRPRAEPPEEVEHRGMHLLLRLAAGPGHGGLSGLRLSTPEPRLRVRDKTALPELGR